MSIPGGLKYGLLAGFFAATLLSSFPMLAAMAIVLQFAVLLAMPLFAVVALAVPRTRRILLKAAEPRPVVLPAVPKVSPPSPVSMRSSKEVLRLFLTNGLAFAAAIAGAVVAFPLLAALGFVFQFLALFVLFVVLILPFLAWVSRTPECSR